MPSRQSVRLFTTSSASSTVRNRMLKNLKHIVRLTTHIGYDHLHFHVQNSYVKKQENTTISNIKNLKVGKQKENVGVKRLVLSRYPISRYDTYSDTWVTMRYVSRCLPIGLWNLQSKYGTLISIQPTLYGIIRTKRPCASFCWQPLPIAATASEHTASLLKYKLKDYQCISRFFTRPAQDCAVLWIDMSPGTEAPTIIKIYFDEKILLFLTIIHTKNCKRLE